MPTMLLTAQRCLPALMLLTAALLADTPGARAHPETPWPARALTTPTASFAATPPLAQPSPQAAASAWAQVGPAGDLPAVRAIALDGPALAEGTQIVIASNDGIYRSTNGGAAWSDWSAGLPVRAAATVLLGPDGSFYAAAGGLVLRRARSSASWSLYAEGLPTPGVISCLAASSGGIMFAADCSSGPSATRLVFRRAPGDLGWVAFNAGLPPARQISGLAASTAQVYLSLRDGNEIYASPLDATGWVTASADLPIDANDITALVVGPDDALYAGLSRRLASAASRGGIARLNPAAAAWQSLNDSAGGAGSGGLSDVDVRALAVAPGGHLFVLAVDGRLYSSEGAPESISWTMGGQVAGPLTLALSPRAVASPPDSTVFVGSQAGLLRSLSLGRSFSALNDGLARPLDLADLALARDGTLFAAGGGRAYRSGDDGASWTTLLDLDNERITALVPSADYGLDGALFAATSDSAGLALSRSTDRGASWDSAPLPTLAAGAQVVALRSSPAIQRDASLFALLPGPVQAGGAGGVLRSINRGVSWDSIGDGLSGRTLRTLAIAPTGASAAPLLAGSDSGVLSFDGARWAPFGGSAISEVQQIAFSPSFATDGALFAAGPGGLYRYQSQGAGWLRAPAELPASPVTALAVSPDFARDTTLLVAAPGGVWVSRDAGASWRAFSAGLPTSGISRLAFSARFAGDRRVYAGGSGGLFKAALPPPAPPWLGLLYLAGDDTAPDNPGGLLTSLSEPLQLLLGRLDRMPYNPALRLVVLYDGPAKGDSRLYVRQPTGLEPVAIVPPWFPSDNELNSGSVSTLRNFISWSQTSFPGAQHTFLALVDHGGGWAPDFGDAAQPGARRRKQAGSWRGMSIDEASGGASLSTRDTSAALDGLGPFDVVFFDACLMGMIESAYEIQPSADYYVAGENLLWAGLPYDRYLAADVLTTTTTPRELAQQIVARYNLPAEAGAAAPEPFAIAAIDMAKLPNLKDKTSALATQLLAALPPTGTVALDNPTRAAITRAYRAAQKFDYDVSLSIDPTDGYVDLADFARQLQRPENFISPSVSAAAATLAEAIVGKSAGEGAVIAARAVSGMVAGLSAPWSFTHANGLAIYLPLGEQDRRLTGPPAEPGGPATEQRQLDFYTNCNFSGCGQLAFTRDAPAWARLLVRLEDGTPTRNLDERPFRSPAPLGEPLAKYYVPAIYR